MDLIKKKKGEYIDGVYVTAKSIVKIKCENGHIWKTRMTNILVKNNWCNVCSRKLIGQQNSVRLKGKPCTYIHTTDTTRKMVNTKYKTQEIYKDSLCKDTILTCKGPHCPEKKQPITNFRKKLDKISGYKD